MGMKAGTGASLSFAKGARAANSRTDTTATTRAWRRSRFAAHSLWQAHQYAEAERDAALAALDTTSPEDTLVLRDGAEVRALRLPPGGWAWLTALAADAPLGDALEAAAHDSPHAAADDLLRLLLRLPLVTHFLIPD